MKKYVKPEIKIIDLRPEEQIGVGFTVDGRPCKTGSNPSCKAKS